MKGQHVFGLPFGDRPVLDFEANAAQIQIVPLEAGELPRIESKRPGAPLEMKLHGETLRVRLAGNWETGGWEGGVIESAVAGFLRGAYGGMFTLHLPAGVKARIGANMGQVRIRGLAGCDLEVVTNAGELQLEDCRGRFALRAKAGQIVGKRLGGTFAIETGAGEAQLDIVELDDGVHTVHSTMGAVKIDLRPGIDVRIESRTVMGSTRTKYPSKSDAKAVLKLEAELGAVKVREGGVYEDPRHGDWPDWRNVWSQPETPAPAAHPSSDLRTILELVQNKKISAEEAERLIAAL